MEGYQEVNEISLVDLMFYCLKRWRWIVVCMLLLAAAAGVYKYQAVIAENQVKEKYGVSGKYFMVANQFWVHKNHMTLFRAIKRLVDRGHKDIRCVCTGALKDYRNQDYYESLETFLRENGLWDHIKILGFIDRKDQLQLMKNAVAVVQPSLFEGWGTVVEDAKTLQKVIVLSDIAVHQEQKNEDCILFGKNDDLQLAEILEGLWEEFRQKEVRHGYQLEKAAEYGKRFYDAITSGS